LERDGEMAAAGEALASCSGGEMAALLGAAPRRVASPTRPLRLCEAWAWPRGRGGDAPPGRPAGAGEAAGGGRPIGFGDAGVGRRGGVCCPVPACLPRVRGLGVGLLVGWAEYNEANGLVYFSGRSDNSGTVAQNLNYPN